MRFRNLLLIAAVAVAACGAQFSAGIADGTYSGVNSSGQEVQVALAGSAVTVDSTRADVDQTALDLTFDVQDSGHARWVCRPVDQGIRCQVTQRRHHQVIELTQI